MKFRIDTLEGETIETAIWNVGVVFRDDDVLQVRGVPCVLSTARSLEAEALKEATAIIQQGIELLHETDKLREWAGVRTWLEKWGRD